MNILKKNGDTFFIQNSKDKLTFYSILLKILSFAKDKPFLFLIAGFPLFFATISLIAMPIFFLLFFYIENAVIRFALSLMVFILLAPVMFYAMFLFLETQINLVYNFLLPIKFTWITKIFERLIKGTTQRQFLHKLIKWTTAKESKLTKKRSET